MKSINIKEAKEMIKDAKRNKGQFFGVHFVSREGEQKVINAKAGVREGISGKGKRYIDELKGLVTIWARNRDGFRSIPLEGVHTIKFNNETYRVTPDKRTLLVGWGIKPLFE